MRLPCLHSSAIDLRMAYHKWRFLWDWTAQVPRLEAKLQSWSKRWKHQRAPARHQLYFADSTVLATQNCVGHSDVKEWPFHTFSTSTSSTVLYIDDLPETVVAAWFHFSPMDLKPCFRWRACCAASSFLCPSRASTAMPSVQGCRAAWHLSTFWTLRSCNASRFTTLTTLRSCTSLTLKPHDPLKLGPRIQASSLGTKSAPMCHNVIRKKYNLQFKKDIQFSITIISKLCYGCNKSCADRCDPLHLWLGLPSLHVSTSQLKHSAGISVLRDCWDSCGSNSKHIISMISIISILVLLERVNNSVLTATVVSLPFRDIDVGRFEGQRFIILYLRRPLTARTALLAGVRARSCEKASRPVAAWNKIWFSWAVLFLHWHQAYTSASACLCRMERLLTPEFS